MAGNRRVRIRVLGGKIETKNIARKASRSKKLKSHISKYVTRLVSQNKTKLLSEFDKHPVTKEIEAGPHYGDRNISGTLEGYGNLFSYIGFRKGSSPVLLVRKLLQNSFIYMGLRGSATARPRGFNQNVRIKIPDKQEIESVSKMPWEPSSWVYGIERGISGFGFYMNTRWRGSRSGFGAQIKHVVNPIGFKPTSYLPTMLEIRKAKIRAGKI